MGAFGLSEPSAFDMDMGSLPAAADDDDDGDEAIKAAVESASVLSFSRLRCSLSAFRRRLKPSTSNRSSARQIESSSTGTRPAMVNSVSWTAIWKRFLSCCWSRAERDWLVNACVNLRMAHLDAK